jgi:hypothetical protein
MKLGSLIALVVAVASMAGCTVAPRPIRTAPAASVESETGPSASGDDVRRLRDGGRAR